MANCVYRAETWGKDKKENWGLSLSGEREDQLQYVGESNTPALTKKTTRTGIGV
jgi:hypothetical protein